MHIHRTNCLHNYDTTEKEFVVEDIVRFRHERSVVISREVG